MTKEWTCPHCGGRETWFDKKTLTYLPDSKTRCSRCGRTDERKELILSEVNGDNLDIMVRNLDGLRIGRMGINKCTAANDVWLTVYDADAEENDKEFFKDEQLSFRPAELLAFCREVIRVTNARISGCTPSAEADCSALHGRIAELENGLRQIAVWNQSDQDDRETCALQWRGCVAIARELLKPNIQLSNKQ